MKNIGQMVKQAQELQERMSAMQAELAKHEVEGASGAGMIKVVVTGKGELRKVKIDPSLIDPKEPEVLEDLIVAAVNDARAKVEAHVAAEMGKLTGGLQLPPGMKLPF
ncbi:MAG: YbaB/EbfC family nucleoid-associated protein [Alphaproteobacteria bacterium]|nr:YbaB/EbfC family nucleoid-associated protein [Alphaproteobacteria bacterium]